MSNKMTVRLSVAANVEFESCAVETEAPSRMVADVKENASPEARREGQDPPSVL